MNESDESRDEWRRLHGREVARPSSRIREPVHIGDKGATVRQDNRRIFVVVPAGRFRDTGEPTGEPTAEVRKFFSHPKCLLNFTVAHVSGDECTLAVIGPARELARRFDAPFRPAWCRGVFLSAGGRVAECRLPSSLERADGRRATITSQSEPTDRHAARPPGILPVKAQRAIAYRRQSARQRAAQGADVVGRIDVERDDANPERFRAVVR